MTLDGTNTWVLVEPGHDQAVVVDPGPDDAEHRAAVLGAVHAAGAETVALIVLTHGHPDHAEGAAPLAAHTKAPVRALAPALCRGAEPLADGERLHLAGLSLEVIATPGHTADSACLVLPADWALLSGDTVLGAGSTVVAHPQGRLADYLESLRRLRSDVSARQLRVVLPGHGPARDDAAALIDGYLAHREERLDQVRAAIAGGATSVEAVLARVYGDVDDGLLFAARWSLLAQLEFLRDRGEAAPAT